LLLTILVMCVSFVSAKQIPVKTKKDVLFVNNVQVATFTGKVSLFKGDSLNVFNLKGDSIFSLRNFYYKFKLPLIPNFRGWTIYFPQIKDTIYVENDLNFLGSKPLLNTLVNSYKLYFDASGIPVDSVKSFIARNDKTTKLNKEKSNQAEYIKILDTQVKRAKLPRADTLQVLMVKYDSRKGTERIDTMKYLVMQKNIFRGEEFWLELGYINVIEKINSSSSSTTSKIKYDIYKKVENSIEYNGKRLNYFLIACTDYYDKVPVFNDKYKLEFLFSDMPAMPLYYKNIANIREDLANVILQKNLW
jgi:hypothetical protein